MVILADYLRILWCFRLQPSQTYDVEGESPGVRKERCGDYRLRGVDCIYKRDPRDLLKNALDVNLLLCNSLPLVLGI